MAVNIIPPPTGSHQNCRVCRNHFIPALEQIILPLRFKLYAGRLTNKEAQTEIDRELQAISDDSAYIKSMLSLYGDAIYTRWDKWKVQRRGETLSSLAPKCFGGEFRPPVKYAMPAGMTIQDWTYEMPRKTSKNDVDMSVWASEKYKHGCSRMTPWIYIEEFAEDPMRLLSLLHVRSEYTSRDWAEFDTRETLDIIGRPPLSFMPPMFNAKCVEMQGDNYGQLTDLDADIMHSGAISSFPRAHLTFRVQSTILSGLRKIVNAIAEGLKPSGNKRWARLVNEGFQTSASELRWGAYFSQAYVQPSNFDPVVLLDMARTQLNYVKDRVEFLQTDQEYMRNYALQVRAGIFWETDVSLSTKYAYVAGTIVTMWTTSLVQWQAIYDITEKLVETCRAHDVASCPGMTLPAEAATVFQEWISLVEEAMHVQVYFLRAALADMRPMNDMYRKCETNGKLYGERRTPEHDWAGQKRTEDKQRPSHRIEIFVCFLVGILRGENAYGAKCAFEQLLEELSKVKPDKRVDDAVSTLALLDSMRLQFLSNRLVPYDRSGSTEHVPEAELDEYAMWTRWPQKGVVDLESDSKKYRQLGLLLQQLCDIKWPEMSVFSSEPPSVTPANLLERSHQATEARGCLKSFWQFARDSWSLLCKDPAEHADLSIYRGLINERLIVLDKINNFMLARRSSIIGVCGIEEHFNALMKEDTRIDNALEKHVFPCLNKLIFGRLQASTAKEAFQNMSFDLSHKYLADVENERKLFDTKIQSAIFLAEDKAASRTSVVQTTWGVPTTGGYTITSERKKIKTIGVATNEDIATIQEEQAAVPDDSSEPVHKMSILVKQDSLDLFGDMFSTHSKFGDVRWESFVSAMSDAGYPATQAEGCRVGFFGEQGSNVFHQPHDRTIDPIMLRQFGKSFNSRFGWDKETFILRPKTDEQPVIEEPKKKKKKKKK